MLPIFLNKLVLLNFPTRPVLLFLLRLSIHFSKLTNNPALNIQRPIKERIKGRINESNKRLFVNPVEIVLAP